MKESSAVKKQEKAPSVKAEKNEAAIAALPETVKKSSSKKAAKTTKAAVSAAAGATA